MEGCRLEFGRESRGRRDEFSRGKKGERERERHRTEFHGEGEERDDREGDCKVTRMRMRGGWREGGDQGGLGINTRRAAKVDR